MSAPKNTYRIQFNKDFTFSDLDGIIDYLKSIGVDAIYASPIFKSVSGSTHGYDGTNLKLINPEIGTYEQLRRIKEELRKADIKWIQDIVPNHMAYHQDNAPLMDLLEYGPLSTYASYFDTVYAEPLWYATELDSKIMVPILDKSPEEAIQKGEIKVIKKDNKLRLHCAGMDLPLAPISYRAFPADLKEDEINQELQRINANKKALVNLLGQQHYQLCHWQQTDQRINFRRFFTINGLICINVQNKLVFDDSHAYVKQLIEEGIFDGLRIDHVDGLYNPTQYLHDLRALAGPDTYIVVEKILERGERLPQDWPIQGTSGYEFLGLCNHVLNDRNGKDALTNLYHHINREKVEVDNEEAAKKKLILDNHLQGELLNLCHFLKALRFGPIWDQADLNQIKQVVGAFLVHLPVYRTYGAFPLSPADYAVLIKTMDELEELPLEGNQVVHLIRKMLEDAQHENNEEYREKATLFLSRCMQFAGPVMAKGVEDTLMYTYNRHLGVNEVGSHPRDLGLSIDSFHLQMADRLQHWPLSMNTTATHDTKRGEDARCRLQVLSAWPELWAANVHYLEGIIATDGELQELPLANDRYAIYQAILGSHPMPHQSPDKFESRLREYLLKYVREGKVKSNWQNPNTQYEDLLHQFATRLINEDSPYQSSLNDLLEKIADFGIINSLSQIVLKFTSPGIPDMYQGTELWDLSFVDPDNRRPIDYELMQIYQQEIANIPPSDLLYYLWTHRYSGKIKLWISNFLLNLRKTCTPLSENGSYTPVQVKGKYKRNILAFARRSGDEVLVVAVPLHLAAVPAFRDQDLPQLDWQDTRIVLTADMDSSWENLITQDKGSSSELLLNDVCKELPIVLIQYREHAKPRRSGILMHISSLPSPYGIGDMGKEASKFVETLRNSGQRLWQILPLSPTSAEQSYSPYSTYSTMAGNPFFIAIEALMKDGLLTKSELREARAPIENQVDYEHATTIKSKLLHKAFERASVRHSPAFDDFCHKESYWVNDYALFQVLKAHHNGTAWYDWPKSFQSRDPEAISTFSKQNEEKMKKEKWLQFVFFSQWAKLRKKCRDLGIEVMGDVPLYVAHDSADVWANQSIFALKDDGKMEAIAGVPPDYFNAEGQVWGMPLYRWEIVQQQDYKWWIQRLKHQCKLYDKVRLDHFRGFSAYWEIPADEETARNGRWKTGPGKSLFDHIKREIPELPFIAEDLGDIDNAVYSLRDAYQLQGMKVLQFAFGEDMPFSPHIIHHHKETDVVYTGTHDNNTLHGWFHSELERSGRRRLSNYAGVSINRSNLTKQFIRMLYASVANTVIIPMQDVIGLGSKHRMNTPATKEKNWKWRMLPNALTADHQKLLLKMSKRYNR